ncbi:MAG TPA: metallopeptidase family protein [Candidatus Acidoferrales bacterium]|nr:metallopeptidase family protein [Candidatus Acidoferrales bacterium]
MREEAKTFELALKELRKEATRALAELPEEFRARLENVEIVIEKRPRRRDLLAMGLDPDRDTLYGLYQGVPLPERSVLYPPLLPDKITLFAEPLLRDFPEPSRLRKQIRRTIVHEVAHFFGMTDEEIEDLGY